MSIKNLKPGMSIRIAKDPQLSMKKHGYLDGYKQKLGGTIQIIHKILQEKNRIFIVPPSNTHHDTISFVIDDIRYIEKLPSVITKPKLFDPEQLMT